MIDEKKKSVAGSASELTDKALDEDTLDAVSGGEKSQPSSLWAEKAWDWVKGLYTDGEGEQLP